jgi:DNA-directed RNA polymerase subunit K
MKTEYNKYERARIIGARALQIAMGAPIQLKLGKDELEKLKYNPINIAKKEFEEGVLPMNVKRATPEKTSK